jgi:hypothetical protein
VIDDDDSKVGTCHPQPLRLHIPSTWSTSKVEQHLRRHDPSFLPQQTNALSESPTKQPNRESVYGVCSEVVSWALWLTRPTAYPSFLCDCRLTLNNTESTYKHVSQRTRCWRSRGIEPRCTREWNFRRANRTGYRTDYLAFSLDAQIGGGVSTTPAHGLGSSTTTTSTSTTGINSGLTSGSHHHTTDRDHLDRTGDAHRTSTGAAAANVTKPGYDLDAKNTTSGERGIGGGHGGPTAFESDPSRVGTDRKHDGPRDHSLGGLTGSTVEEVQRQGPGVVRSGDHDLHGKETRGNTFGELDKTGSHGHHDRDHTHDSRTGSNVPVVGSHGRDHESRTGSNIPVVGTHDRTGSNVPVVGGGVPHGEHHSHHTGAGVAAGGLAAGAGAAALGAGGVGGAKPSGYEGVVGDSVTGQQHFKGNSTGLATGAGLAGVGAGAAGLGHRETVGGPAATGVSPGTLSGSSRRDDKPHHKETGLVAELKQELKDHQNCKFRPCLAMLYFSCDLINHRSFFF